MKAWTQEICGTSKDLLSLNEVALPTARPLDLIVQLKGVATNPVDYKKLKGPASDQGKPHPNRKIVGWDGAGVVTAVGEEVTLFQVGDEVYFAGDVTRDGCFAEYVAVDSRVCAHKPRSLDFVTAAAIPLTGLTAYEGFTEVLRLQDGRGLSVLVIAGSGGVGSIATQIAKRILNFDTVIATASREETVQYCLENGADYTINHHENLKEQLSSLGFAQGVDIVFNCATSENWEQIPPCLKPRGRVVMITEMSSSINITEGMMGKRASIHWELMFSRLLFDEEPQVQGEVLEKLARWVDLGIISARVRDDHRYSIKDLPDALDFQQSGRAIGKIVLDCSSWE